MDRSGLGSRGKRRVGAWGGGDAGGVNVKVRAGVCVVAYTRVIDRGPLGSFLRFARGRATNCILANSILLGTLLSVCIRA